MPSCQTTWEDDENNRHIELTVDYQLDGERVDIQEVRPQRVHLFHPRSSKLERTLRVRTDAGRRLLARRVDDAGHLQRLARQILSGHSVELPPIEPALSVSANVTTALRA